MDFMGLKSQVSALETWLLIMYIYRGFTLLLVSSK